MTKPFFKRKSLVILVCAIVLISFGFALIINLGYSAITTSKSFDGLGITSGMILGLGIGFVYWYNAVRKLEEKYNFEIEWT